MKSNVIVLVMRGFLCDSKAVMLLSVADPGLILIRLKSNAAF